MNFYGAFFAWLLIAAVLVLGVVLAMKSTALVLIIGLFMFTFLFIKYGCLSH